MKREVKVGDRIKFTGLLGGVYKGEVKAVDGDEAWVLFDDNTNHTSVYLNQLKVVFPPPKFKKGDRVILAGFDTGTALTSHINCDGKRYYWVEYDRPDHPCWGVEEGSVRSAS